MFHSHVRHNEHNEGDFAALIPMAWHRGHRNRDFPVALLPTHHSPCSLPRDVSHLQPRRPQQVLNCPHPCGYPGSTTACFATTVTASNSDAVDFGTGFEVENCPPLAAYSLSPQPNPKLKPLTVRSPGLSSEHKLKPAPWQLGVPNLHLSCWLRRSNGSRAHSLVNCTKPTTATSTTTSSGAFDVTGSCASASSTLCPNATTHPVLSESCLPASTAEATPSSVHLQEVWCSKNQGRSPCNATCSLVPSPHREPVRLLVNGRIPAGEGRRTQADETRQEFDAPSPILPDPFRLGHAVEAFLQHAYVITQMHTSTSSRRWTRIRRSEAIELLQKEAHLPKDHQIIMYDGDAPDLIKWLDAFPNINIGISFHQLLSHQQVLDLVPAGSPQYQ